MSQIQTFDYSANLRRVIPWQYQSAENLLAWLQNKQDNFDADHTQFWDDWYNDVFNINTANEFGVALWAIILELPLLNNLEPVLPNQNWGFGPLRKNFNNGNFSSNGGNPGQLLTLEQKRSLLKMRYQKLVSNNTVTDVNRIMNGAWGDLGNSYVIDNGDMTVTYFFEFTPQPWITYGINTLDILPRPSGVDYDIQTI